MEDRELFIIRAKNQRISHCKKIRQNKPLPLIPKMNKLPNKYENTISPKPRNKIPSKDRQFSMTRANNQRISRHRKILLL